MRISDWSSDVCSSDLPAVAADDNVLQPLFLHQRTDRLADQFGHAHVERLPDHAADVVGAEDAAVYAPRRGLGRVAHPYRRRVVFRRRAVDQPLRPRRRGSCVGWTRDRKSVGWGTGVYVRLYFGGT